MQTLPATIYSVASVREIDRIAIDVNGIAGYTLMTRAGEAALQAARIRFPDAMCWQVICGAGNNGGDGYVVARLAAQNGIAVSVVTLVDPESLKGDAALACKDFLAVGGRVERWAGELDAAADLIVDAILGSGLEREVGGPFADAVLAINQHRAPVLALDIPSGIHGDSGNPLGTAVRADLTVTFVALKSGLFLGRAADFCGEIIFDGLGISEACRSAQSPALRRVDDAELRTAMPARPRSAHKGDFGHVLVVGGGEGMPGAACLCGQAALRAGAGRVSIATAPSHASVLAANRPELMSHGVSGPKDLVPLLQRADVIAFGPGLGRSRWAKALFDVVAADSRPAVWDADALRFLSEKPGIARARVITPHPGEAGALLGRTAADVQTDRPGAVRALQQRYGGVAVLKGSGSLVLADAEPPWICTAGNPGMASAGMGDVLTGVIAALLGQGLPPEQAATLGVYAHATAGDRAALRGERGLIATDLIGELRAVLNP